MFHQAFVFYVFLVPLRFLSKNEINFIHTKQIS